MGSGQARTVRPGEMGRQPGRHVQSASQVRWDAGQARSVRPGEMRRQSGEAGQAHHVHELRVLVR